MTAVNRPFIPVARPQVGEREKAAVMEVLESGQLAMGPRTEAFEARFAEYVGARHAIAVNSGTAALIVALQAHGIGPGDEVITTPFSFIATATSIIACGARPVFIDIDPFDLNLDPALVEDAITERTRAILPVHLYGHPARIAELAELAEDFGLALIEDAAQAHGAEHQGRRVGTFGTGCFSFYPTKNMTTGEGGIITTNDDEVARRARIIRSHGQEVRYRHDLFGLNWRMQDLNAAIGLAQLEQLEDWTRARIANAERLSSQLRGVETPRVRPGDRHVFHQYTIRVPSGRDALQQQLHEAGIGTAVHYPIPIHQQPIIRELGFGDVSLPNAEAAAQHVLSLPVHPALSPEDVDYIAETLNRLRP
ncbi:DegT/DnrJ/EryC1/StrS family aminotransferase [Tepidiforma sp.]|uniref:DegT/DnrJ/EryC1/StrS family aminotransferase n=1 Tax=Tepidiforma sp. TaxID=2682230 RepID=UPI002ADE0A96|nr:DegT/DnrJ/EryC1/StrS family aminotransferase [Tepidiforma sp.]